jgi:predicted O-methyltransferase YrrM
MNRAGEAHSASDDIRTLTRRVVASLESIAGLERIWKHGVVHAGGPHYRLAGTTGPVSIGEDECVLLGRLIARFRPANCFIIGNGFGLSSALIAKAMEANGGVSVVTLDNTREGDGQRCFETAEQLRIRMDCRILHTKVGTSPQDVDTAAGTALYDLVLIDGGHVHPQVINDFRGIRHLVRTESILCWHDCWLPGVFESVAEAQRSGYRCLRVNSSCEMAFGTRDEALFRELELLFDQAETPTRRSHPLARLMLSRSFTWAVIKRHVRRALKK